LRVEAVDGTTHRRLTAGAELGHRAAVVRNPRGLRGRQFGQTRVVRAVVHRRRAVERLTRGAAFEVVVDERFVVADTVRPSVVARTGHEVELHGARRTTVGIGRTGVGTVVTDVDPSGLLVHREPERVAEAHRVDLGTGLLGTRFEQVALGDGVAAVLLHRD